MQLRYTEIEIKSKIVGLCEFLSNKLREDSKPSVFVCNLSGAFMFYSDIIKNLDENLRIKCDFICTEKYHDSSTVKLNWRLYPKVVELEDHHVYIIDDILDSGETLQLICDVYRTLNPATLNVITLLEKAESRKVLAKADTVMTLMDVENKWVIGYGMDSKGGYSRNLKGIYFI